MRRFVLWVLALLHLSLCASCLGRMTSEDAAQIRSVIDAQLAALNNNDVKAYMETVAPDSPVYAETEQKVTDLIATCPTQSKIIDFNFVSSNAFEAQVRATMESSRVEPGYKSARSTMLFLMRKLDGRWKMYGSQLEKTEQFE